MTEPTRSGAAALAALALAGGLLSACEQRMAANSDLCAQFKTSGTGQATTANAPVAATDAAAPVDDCVRRWAYSLAAARDDADVVAQSAVAACAGALTRWNQSSMSQASAAPDMAGQGVSLATGEPTSPLAAHAAFAQQRALLYVVEARAGRCAPPPATNGVPAGTTG